MTNSDNDAGRSESSDSPAGGSEPSSAGYEAPPIEHTQDTGAEQPQNYPPPAYNPPPVSGYDQPPAYTPTTGYPPSGGFAAPEYPPPGSFAAPDYPPPAGYPPPYPDAGSPPPYPGAGYAAPGPGYPPPDFAGPSYPPPPYGAVPGGYPPAGGWTGTDFGYGPPPPQGTNPMAIGSLVASCAGLFCCLGSIVGIVLGIVAMSQIKQTHQDGQGLAIAGIVVGVLTLLISGIATLAIMGSGSS